jgi:hypothetical protein
MSKAAIKPGLIRDYRRQLNEIRSGLRPFEKMAMALTERINSDLEACYEPSDEAYYEGFPKRTKAMVKRGESLAKVLQSGDEILTSLQDAIFRSGW